MARPPAAPDGMNVMSGIASFAKIIIFIGIATVIFGLVVLLLSHVIGDRGSPLPGDIVFRRDNLTVYFPIVTCLVVSMMVTLLLFIIAALRG